MIKRVKQEHQVYTQLTRVECLGDHMDIFPIPQDAVHTCVGRRSS